MKTEQIENIRDFNRFYAKVIGVLDKTYMDSSYSLAEARILREIFLQPDITAQEILHILELDKGYLSRILKTFEKKKLLLKKQSETDGRFFNLSLTAEGEAEFLKIDNLVIEQIKRTFSPLTENEYEQLYNSMVTIKNILQKK